MKHTLVAAFATSTDANRTVGDLMSRGIAREQIHSVGADSANIHAYDAPYSTEGGTVDRELHEGKGAHFFKSLFGHEPHEEHRRHATAYPEAVRRGALVIAVDVHDDDQLVRARDALEYNGALNIDEVHRLSSSNARSISTRWETYSGRSGIPPALLTNSRTLSRSSSAITASPEKSAAREANKSPSKCSASSAKIASALARAEAESPMSKRRSPMWNCASALISSGGTAAYA